MARSNSASANTIGTDHPFRSGVRAIASWVLIGFCCIAFGTLVITHWVEQQFLTTNNWVTLVGPLPQQSVVATALANYITDQIYAAVPIQQEITDALPPKASFLASPLASQLHSLTVSTAQKVVSSDQFQAIWLGANRIALNRILAKARGQSTPLQSKLNEKFNINISDVSGQLSSALGSASNAIPALQPASKKLLAITTDLHARGKRLRETIQSIDFLAAVLPLAIIASLLGALALSYHRRRSLAVLAILIIFFMISELIALNVGRQNVLDQVHNPSNLQAVGYIYDVFVSNLKHMIYVVIAIALLLICLLVLTGPAGWAKSARSFIHSEKLSSIFIDKWQEIQNYIDRWELYIMLALTLAVLAIAALAQNISVRYGINILLLIISLIAAVHILATLRRPSIQKL